MGINNKITLEIEIIRFSEECLECPVRLSCMRGYIYYNNCEILKRIVKSKNSMKK